METSSPTPRFKVGDRVRTTNDQRIGFIDQAPTEGVAAGWLRVDSGHIWQWTHPDGCRLAQPMSPQARAVFHAMRAGAGRVNTYMCMGEKVRTYATPDGSLSIEVRS